MNEMTQVQVRNAAEDLIATLEAEAGALQRAETELRKRMQAEIEVLARRRVFAYRRTRLMTLLVRASTRADEGDYAVSQRRAVSEALGWDGETEANQKILDELARVGEAVRGATHGDAPPGDIVSVRDALSTFEQWFEALHGKSFYALFDQYVSEAPVVDF